MKRTYKENKKKRRAGTFVEVSIHDVANTSMLGRTISKVVHKKISDYELFRMEAMNHMDIYMAYGRQNPLPLDHPPALLRSFPDKQRYCIEMEYLPSTTLKEACNMGIGTGFGQRTYVCKRGVEHSKDHLDLIFSAIFHVLRFTILSKYFHFDLHASNILLDINSNGFALPIPIGNSETVIYHCHIIDFLDCEKIPDSLYTEFLGLWSLSNYEELHRRLWNLFDERHKDRDWTQKIYGPRGRDNLKKFEWFNPNNYAFDQDRMHLYRKYYETQQSDESYSEVVDAFYEKIKDEFPSPPSALSPLVNPEPKSRGFTIKRKIKYSIRTR